MRYIGYGLLIVLLMSGCVRRFRHIPMEPAPVVDQNRTESKTTRTGTLYDTTRTEHKYKLKPEPYSVGSKEKDPELLEPQGTIQEADKSVELNTPVEIAADQPALAPTASTTTTLTSAMGKQECISMIGTAKFERYSKRFGGESGAIKRCAILKKLKQG